MTICDQRFVGLIQGLGALSGLDQLSSTIFALLYLEPEEISMEELAKKTGYSLASISNKVKVLEPTGFIKKIQKPGSRKIYLYAEKNYFKVFREQLLKMQETKLKMVNETMPEIIRNCKVKISSDKDRKKLRIFEGYYDQCKKFESVVSLMTRELDKVERGGG